MASPTSARTLEWEGGALSDLVSALQASALPVRIEVIAPGPVGSSAGEVHLIAGGLADAFAGSLRRDDAMAALQRVEGARFLVECRLPDPGSGTLTPAGPDTGSLKDRPLAALMRYCEDYVLTCRVEIERGQEQASVNYKRGELVGTTSDGKEADDRLPAMLAWPDGAYRIVLPAPELPPGRERRRDSQLLPRAAEPERKRHPTLPSGAAVSRPAGEKPTTVPPVSSLRLSPAPDLAAPAQPLAAAKVAPAQTHLSPGVTKRGIPAMPPSAQSASTARSPAAGAAPPKAAAPVLSALGTRPVPGAASATGAKPAPGPTGAPVVPAKPLTSGTAAKAAASSPAPQRPQAVAPPPAAPASLKLAAPPAAARPTLPIAGAKPAAPAALAAGPASPKPAAPTAPPAAAARKPAAPAAPAAAAWQKPAAPTAPPAATASQKPAAPAPSPAAAASQKPAAPAPSPAAAASQKPAAPAPSPAAAASQKPAAPTAPLASSASLKPAAAPSAAKPAPAAAAAAQPLVKPSAPAALSQVTHKAGSAAAAPHRDAMAASANQQATAEPPVTRKAETVRMEVAQPAAPTSDKPPPAPATKPAASNDLKPTSGTIQAKPRPTSRPRLAAAPVEVEPEPAPQVRSVTPAAVTPQLVVPQRPRISARKRPPEQPVRVYVYMGLAIGVGVVLAYWLYFTAGLGR